MNYSISNYIHYIIANKINKDFSVLDMGGVEKLKKYCPNTQSANIRYGIDCTKLSFDNNSFDVCISVAVIEHVGSLEKQYQFINESIRVAKHKIIHWFPISQEFEDLTLELGHNHNCIIPDINRIKKSFNASYTEFITIREQGFALSTLHPKLNCLKMMEFIEKHGNEPYGILMEIDKC